VCVISMKGEEHLKRKRKKKSPYGVHGGGLDLG
jgi:hypothetical protein